MNAKLRMPTSGRDFEIYLAVRVAERTTRDVAGEFGISQTRVCQIVERVAEFMLDAVPEGTEADHAKRVQVAEQVAALRLQHLYGTAVRDYEASKGKPVIREINAEGRPRTTITTTRPGIGDVKLLDRAVKFALASAKLPVATLAQHVAWEEGEARDAGSEARDVMMQGDCSDPVHEAAVPMIPAAPAGDTTADESSDCVRAMLDVLQRNDGAGAPVQTGSSEADERLSGRQKSARRAFLAAAG